MRVLTPRDFFLVLSLGTVGFCKRCIPVCGDRPACRSPSLGRAADSLLDTTATRWHRPRVKCFSSRTQPHASRSALDNQFRMSILERLEQMERRMAEMTGSQQHKQASSGGGSGSGSGSGAGGGQAQVGPAAPRWQLLFAWCFICARGTWSSLLLLMSLSRALLRGACAQFAWCERGLGADHYSPAVPLGLRSLCVPWQLEGVAKG